jgi:hypothetical protein
VADQNDHSLLRNNVPEVLRLALHEPVTVVKDGRQIACIVSLSSSPKLAARRRSWAWTAGTMRCELRTSSSRTMATFACSASLA